MKKKERRIHESNFLLSSSRRDGKVRFARADFLFSPDLRSGPQAYRIQQCGCDSLFITLLQAMEGEGEEQVKSRRQAARAAHRRIRIAQSDALNALSAFISWQGADSKEDFCRCAALDAV